MRRPLLVLGLLAAMGAPAGAVTFEEANQLYDQGNFAAAQSAYEALAAQGEESANLYYNLGNARFRQAALGAAALEFERALALEPGHPEASTNLELVRRKCGARLLPPGWLEPYLLSWSGLGFCVLAAVGAWLGVGAVAFMARERRESFLAWGALIAGLAAVAYAGAALQYLGGRRSQGVVLAKEATARVAPADRAAVVEKLPAGSQVRVVSERGAWTYCELPGRTRGWLPQTTIGKLVPPPHS